MISPRKNLPLLVRAARTEPRVRVVVGERLWPEVDADEDVAALQQESRLVVVDRLLDPADFDAALSVVDVAAVLYDSDAPSGILAEACARGTPVIVPRGAWLARVTESTNVGRATELTVAGIAATLRAVDADREAYVRAPLDAPGAPANRDGPLHLHLAVLTRSPYASVHYRVVGKSLMVDLRRPTRHPSSGALMAITAVVVLAVVALLLSGIGSTPSTDPSEPTGPIAPGAIHPSGPGGAWHLVFHDEFDGSELDRTKWIPCLSAGWTLQEPQSSCPTWGTQLQTYRPDNVRVGGGALHLVAEKEPDGSVSSGSFSTAEDVYGYHQPGYRPFGYRYGYFEARFRAPDDSGMWPAVWEMPVGGGARGEMDLFEIMSTRDDPERIKMTLHGSVPSVVVGQATPQIADIAENYHTFGAEWTPNSLTFYVDGRAVKTVTGQIPNGYHFIQANLAVGGEFVPPVSPDQEYPRSLDIDYMRVFQRN